MYYNLCDTFICNNSVNLNYTKINWAITLNFASLLYTYVILQL